MSTPTKTVTSRGGFLEFMVAAHYYAVPIVRVREINPIGEITPVPKAGAHVCGVMNLRGQVLPVIDLKVRLYGQPTFKTRNSCVVVVGTREGVIGLLVDSVCRVVEYAEGKTSTAPEACHLPDKSLVAGMAHDGQKMITLLSMDECIRAIDCTQIRSVQQLRAGTNPTTGVENATPASGEPVIRDAPSANLALRSAALRLMD
jgi:purine-binding chemotaxis protein CheW